MERSRGLTAAGRCRLHGGSPVWNYINGRLREGGDASGRCLTLERARQLATKINTHRPFDTPFGCLGIDGTECCGSGNCTEQADGNFKCVFPPNVNSYECVPEMGACIGKDGTQCCGRGICTHTPGVGWGCQFENGYDWRECLPLLPGMGMAMLSVKFFRFI